MSDDLVKRLRYAAIRARKEYPEVFCVSEELAFEAANCIEHLEAELVYTFKNFMEEGLRAEKLEAALDDALQFVSRADWHYLKDETRKALEGKE